MADECDEMAGRALGSLERLLAGAPRVFVRGDSRPHDAVFGNGRPVGIDMDEVAGGPAEADRSLPFVRARHCPWVEAGPGDRLLAVCVRPVDMELLEAVVAWSAPLLVGVGQNWAGPADAEPGTADVAARWLRAVKSGGLSRFIGADRRPAGRRQAAASARRGRGRG